MNRIEKIYDAIDGMARDYDSYEFGLPGFPGSYQYKQIISLIEEEITKAFEAGRLRGRDELDEWKKEYSYRPNEEEYIKQQDL